MGDVSVAEWIEVMEVRGEWGTVDMSQGENAFAETWNYIFILCLNGDMLWSVEGTTAESHIGWHIQKVDITAPQSLFSANWFPAINPASSMLVDGTWAKLKTQSARIIIWISALFDSSYLSDVCSCAHLCLKRTGRQEKMRFLFCFHGNWKINLPGTQKYRNLRHQYYMLGHAEGLVNEEVPGVHY